MSAYGHGMRHRTALATLLLALTPVAGLSGCSSDEAPTATGGSETSSTAATDPSTSEDTTDADATDSTIAKVDANTATVEEMTAAFEAAGIANAAKWAHEVEEYRPYDTGDPNFTHLRDELAKYNPSAETVEQIISTLSL